MKAKLLWMSVLLLSVLIIGVGIISSAQPQEVSLSPQEQLEKIFSTIRICH